MKYKNRQKRLQARIKWYENLPKAIQGGYTKPGSQKK